VIGGFVVRIGTAGCVAREAVDCMVRLGWAKLVNRSKMTGMLALGDGVEADIAPNDGLANREEFWDWQVARRKCGTSGSILTRRGLRFAGLTWATQCSRNKRVSSSCWSSNTGVDTASELGRLLVQSSTLGEGEMEGRSWGHFGGCWCLWLDVLLRRLGHDWQNQDAM
jgi:hypothetical protein